jgi:hypothetical protein
MPTTVLYFKENCRFSYALSKYILIWKFSFLNLSK